MSVHKPWGWEKTWVNNELYCMKLLCAQGNIWSSSGLYHMHIDKDETFVVGTGVLELDIAGRVFKLKPGERKRVPPLTPHRFRSDLCLFQEVSTPDTAEDTVRGTLEDLRNWRGLNRATAH